MTPKQRKKLAQDNARIALLELTTGHKLDLSDEIGELEAFVRNL